MTDISSALYKIADAIYELAQATEQAGSGERAPDSAPPDILEEVDDDGLAPILQATGGTLVPQGSEAVCPKHRKPYKDGQYGPFCTQRSDEPAWANERGYCKITPRNAAVWLRQHAGVPA